MILCYKQSDRVKYGTGFDLYQIYNGSRTPGIVMRLLIQLLVNGIQVNGKQQHDFQ